MSDSLEYAKMSEIPVSSCEIVALTDGKKDVKKRVINKVNTKLAKTENKPKRLKWFSKKVAKTQKEKPQENKKGFNVVRAQVIAIFVLVISILLTNIFWEDSAINVFLRKTFTQTEQAVALEYTDFQAQSPTPELEVSLVNGYITATGESTVYAPAQGKISQLNQLESGLWEMTIAHSDSFKTVITGLAYPYYEVGYDVYSTSPIGYADGNAEICVGMYDQDVLITDYTISNGEIIWG